MPIVINLLILVHIDNIKTNIFDIIKHNGLNFLLMTIDLSPQLDNMQRFSQILIPNIPNFNILICQQSNQS